MLNMLSSASFVWLMCTLWVSLGALFYAFPSISPAIILRLYVFGKVRNDKHASKKKDTFLLPKSYFKHFYFMGIVIVSSLLCVSLYTVCGGGEWPQIVHTFVDMMRYPAVESYGDMFSCLIVLICADIQVTRRFLECVYVSVYSPKSEMSFMIYIVGVSFYTALPITAISGTDITADVTCGDVLQNLRWNHIVGVTLFLWASWKQRQVAFQFAKLRQNKSGAVENTRHHIPRGGLFEYVSCPHYFAEILIYLSMNVIFEFRNTMMVWLFVFVFANQIISGHFSHVWYKEKFPNYPKNRKSTIPFIF